MEELIKKLNYWNLELQEFNYNRFRGDLHINIRHIEELTDKEFYFENVMDCNINDKTLYDMIINEFIMEGFKNE